MAYRNKTYVAFASEDIGKYYLMKAWKSNRHIDFNFFNAHELYISRDTSQPATIKRNLRERLKNAKQVVLLSSRDAKRKSDNGVSFLAHEIEVIMEFGIPVVIANLDGGRIVEHRLIPSALLDTDYFTVSVSFQPSIIKYALDDYVSQFLCTNKKGTYEYTKSVYSSLGI